MSEVRTRFQAQVEAQRHALFSVALRLTGNGADAEDLVAETVAKAWYAVGSLEDWSRFRPWIFRIMRNHFTSDLRRAEARSDALPIDDDEVDVASLLVQQSDAFLQWWADPEKHVVDRMMGEDIIDAVNALPEAFRVTILLVNVDGLGYDEAAEVLGVPAGTVRSRMKRGRTLLQKALWEHARDAGFVTAGGISA